MNRLSFAFVTLLVLILISALSVVHARHQSRMLFVDLGQQKQLRDELDVQFGQLQLERGAWAGHGRIEQVARTELNMIIPSQQSVVLIKQ